MPTMLLNGNLIHFEVFEHQIGVYQVPSCIMAFQQEPVPYKQGKRSVQFPLDQPIPHDLLLQIVRYRVAKNLEKKKIKNGVV
ncbi:iron chaperone [Sinobaca qinghaiensis]|uniref:iron chaperone n=1 Tax=Sinobaca qinghaiensis TaxID=342944 RepID=UPI000E734E5B|nr:hypothetical protein [Sinobaca qinghaiensis]